MAGGAICERRGGSGGGDDAAGRQRHTEESAVRIDEVTEGERESARERRVVLCF